MGTSLPKITAYGNSEARATVNVYLLPQLDLCQPLDIYAHLHECNLCEVSPQFTSLYVLRKTKPLFEIPSYPVRLSRADH